MTREELLKSYSYSPDTGEFRATTNRPCRSAGDICGIVNGWGYRLLRVKGKQILAHRAAWLAIHGELPAHEIDHINGNKLDNRIANLRDVTSSVNAQNKRVARCDNKSGLLGVSSRKGGFRAVIHINGKQKYLGVFKTAEEAHEAYLCAKRQLHEGCTL